MFGFTQKDANRSREGQGSAKSGNRSKTARQQKRRLGSVTVMSAFLMIGLLTFAAFSVDLGHLVLVRTELQVAADSSAMAAAASMNLPREEMVNVANEFAGYHRAGGEQIVLADEDVEYGIWDSATRRFTPTTEPGNAVRVTTRAGGADRDGVEMFFGPLVNVLSVRQDASAVAMANPRDIAFVVDLSGSMNDDAEPCWATDAIDTEFAGAGYGNLGTDMLQDIFDDFGFGAVPGSVEYIGEPWGLDPDKYAYAALSDNAGPFTARSVPSKYQIQMSDDELTRKKKVYSAIIDYQIAKTMPDVKPTPNSTTNYDYWERYLDYIIEPVKLKVQTDSGGGGSKKSGGGSSSGGSSAPKPPTGMILPDRYEPHSLRPMIARSNSVTTPTSGFILADGQAWVARLMLAQRGSWGSGSGSSGSWGSGSWGSGSWGSGSWGSGSWGSGSDSGGSGSGGSGSSGDADVSPADLPGVDPSDTGDANWGGQSSFNPDTSNRGSLPPQQSKNRVTSFNNPNRSNFPSVSSKQVRWWRNRIGYVTYIQFMTDFGREMKPDDTTYTPLSAKSPHCPFHSEETRGGTFDFPPRTQPMHATRRALIAAIEVVNERNKSIGSVDQRDWVSLVTFDRLSDGGPVVAQSLTGDYDSAKSSCTTLQACSDKSSSTATEAGLQLAREHIKSASDGGQGREATNKVVVLLTDGAPNLYTTPPGEINSYISDNPSSDFYANGAYWFDAPLMQASQMASEGWGAFPVSVGLGADYNFMDRMARIGGTAGDDGQGPRGSDNPAEYEQQLVEIFERIITSPKVRLVQ